MIDDMGIFRTNITVAPLSRPGNTEQLDDVMVDTGAEYSAIPRTVLDRLGVVPESVERFASADGRVFARDIGFVLLSAGGRVGPTVVMFAEETDMTLLGAHGLEALRLRIDRLRRELVPAGPAPAALLLRRSGVARYGLAGHT